MRIVLDTNVWISSLLLPKSIPGKIVSAWRQDKFKIITSSPILDEIKEVLNYPKIRKRLALSNEELDEFLTLIRFFTENIEVSSSQSFKELRDLDDSFILETYIASKANYLISGDKDLLTLRNRYQVITPAEFLEFL